MTLGYPVDGGRNGSFGQYVGSGVESWTENERAGTYVGQ